MKIYSQPWYCSACGIYVYNLEFVDGNWYPCEGAPTARFLSSTYPRVCNLCWDAYMVLQTSQYWMKIEEESKNQKAKRHNLRQGGDYSSH